MSGSSAKTDDERFEPTGITRWTAKSDGAEKAGAAFELTEEKRKEFVEKGAEVYAKWAPKFI